MCRTCRGGGETKVVAVVCALSLLPEQPKESNVMIHNSALNVFISNSQIKQIM